MASARVGRPPPQAMTSPPPGQRPLTSSSRARKPSSSDAKISGMVRPDAARCAQQAREGPVRSRRQPPHRELAAAHHADEDDCSRLIPRKFPGCGTRRPVAPLPSSARRPSRGGEIAGKVQEEQVFPAPAGMGGLTFIFQQVEPLDGEHGEDLVEGTAWGRRNGADLVAAGRSSSTGTPPRTGGSWHYS